MTRKLKSTYDELVYQFLSCYRPNGEDSKHFQLINSKRRQLLHYNVSGEEGQEGKSLESLEL